MNWKVLSGSLLLLLAVAGLVLYLLVRPATPPSHRIFYNGDVLSMNAENEVFEAISIRGDRIEALGTDDEMLALETRDSVVTDLRGKTLLPGFVDAHGHFPGSGLTQIAADLNSPPIGAVLSMADVQDSLRRQVEQTAAGEWVAGFGYDDTLLLERRHPTREDLDAVSTEHAIYISHVSGHMGVGNSLALERAGISSLSEDPPGGVIVRRAGSREPAGLLEEAAHTDVLQMSMDFSTLDALKILRHASQEYAAAGVTTAQSGGVDRFMAEAMGLLARFNQIKPRLIVFAFHDMLGVDLLNGSFDPAEWNSRRYLIGAVKIVADGSIQGYTGYLSQPYHTPFHGDADYRGYPVLSREELTRAISEFHAAGFQLAVHGNGDASIDDILYAFEQAQRASPNADPRLILIHSQMARDDQLLDMKRLGITPSFFSAHTYYWGDRHRDIFMGPERAARMSPTRSAQDVGLRYSVHLDTPVVPMQPLLLLWSTVNRESTSGQVIGPEQRIGVMQALRAMTIDAAWQVFKEEEIGSLEPGKFADLVVLSGNPLDDPANIRKLSVVETVVGGNPVYEAR